MLQKQNTNINFAQGLNTKTDEKQVPIGQFLDLRNSVFTKGGLLQKRNGFALLPTAPNVAPYITTLADNLTSISDQINALDSSTAQWVPKGYYQPLALSVLPVVRSSYSQVQCDVAVSTNGLACVVYSEQQGFASVYKYVVANATTGQNIVPPTVISGASGPPLVWFVDGYFVVVYNNGSGQLAYIAISSNNPSITTSSLVVSTPVNGGYNGAVVGNRLFIAFNSSSGGQSVKITYLTQANLAGGIAGHAPLSWTGSDYTPSVLSVCSEPIVSGGVIINYQIYVSFPNSAQTAAYTASCYFSLANAFNPQALHVDGGGGLSAITSAAQSGSCQVFLAYQIQYPWSSAPYTAYITSQPVSNAGSVGSTTVTIRDVSLASEAFIVSGNVYVLTATTTDFQSTYFLVAGTSLSRSPRIVAKLAYENGGGYPETLSHVSVAGNTATLAYLYKDLVEALSTINNTQQSVSGGVYSQTGVNVASFKFGDDIDTAEIAGNLHIGGGFLWNYDGTNLVEHDFVVWPEPIHADNYTSYTFTGTITSSSSVVTAIAGSDDTRIGINQNISGTAIPTSTTVERLDSPTQIEMSAAATGSHTAESITVTGNQTAQQYYYAVIYEWTDAKGNVYTSAPSIPYAVTGQANSFTRLYIPTLRLTYKTSVRIMVYRWSAAQEVYYQVTTPTNPLLNDTTVDYVTFVDPYSDAQILGNSILYTTGGVLEDVNAPATNIISLFDTRLWMVDAEDPNLLWYSKQVIEATPVEMSDLLTFYIAPTSGSQGSTGSITALSPMDDKLVIFKRDAIYYINGSGPDNTGANNQYSQPIFVTSTVGSANQLSIVFTPNGLMFQSDKGIWLLDRGMGTTYIGAPVEKFTQSALVKSALNIPGTNQVRFTMDSGITLMYDYFYQQWGVFEGIPAVSSCIYQQLQTFVDSYGRVFQESPGSYVDGSNPVLLSFTTGWLNLTGLQGYQRAYFFYLLGQYLSPHKLQIGIAYDYNPAIENSVLITPTNFSGSDPGPFGEPVPFEGNPSPLGPPAAVESWRVFLGRQRCMAFQITLNEVYDPSFGVAAGAGLTLSGINLVYGSKKGFRPQAAALTAGTK